MQFIQCHCSTFFNLINFLNLYHNIFYIAQSQKLSRPALRPRRIIAPVEPRIRPPARFIFHSVRADSNPTDWSSSSPPPPHFCSHYNTWGKNYKRASVEGSRGGRERKYTAGRQAGEKLSRGGVKIIRRRSNYPGRAQVPKNSKKNPKIVAQCQKYPIPNLYTLNRTIPYLYTLNRTIPFLYTSNRTIPYLNILSRTIPYLNT